MSFQDYLVNSLKRSGRHILQGLHAVVQGKTYGQYLRDKKIRDRHELITRLQLGQIALQAAGAIRRPRWSKYEASVNRDTSTAQTNYYEGYVGETDSRMKVHIAVDERGRLLYVRDIDGTELFDRSKGHQPPPG